MSLRPRKSAMHEEHQEPRCSVLKRTQHKRRWRLAFTAISFTRALAYYLSKKPLQHNAALFRRSLPYVSIDVGKAPSFLDVDPKALGDAVRAKNLKSFADQFGGVKQLAEILETNTELGISTESDAEFARRKNVFGANEYKPRRRNFLSFLWEASKKCSIATILCITISLVLGVEQQGWKDGWFNGNIIFAVVLVVAISALFNFLKDREFLRLSAMSTNAIKTEVVRDGRRRHVLISDVVVGDIVCLKIGDQVPADGFFLEGQSLKVDELTMTGESDHVEIDDERNPFLLCCTKVVDGFGSMLVASVGMNTAWGEMMSSVSRELDETTPLQARLKKLMSCIGRVALSVAVLVLPVMWIRYFTGSTSNRTGEREFNGGKTSFNEVIKAMVRTLAVAVTIVVAAVPEGLPLAVTLTMVYSMKRMMEGSAMVRKLSACETLGSTSMICTDKTGTLTLNEMQVTEVWLGGQETINNGRVERTMLSNMSQGVLRLLQEAVGLNTAGSIYKPSSKSVAEVCGSPTEKAILSWGLSELGLDIDQVKRECEIVQVEAFNSENKRSGVLMKRRSDNRSVEAHWKGAAEMVLAMCSSLRDGDGNVKDMDDGERRRIETVIKNMAAKSLRCIAFAHKEIELEHGPNYHEKKLEESGLTLLGLIGLKDPYRPGVRAAVDSCIAAGITVKMITGDNVNTARAIAIECGILNPDEDEDNAVIEGVEFRNYSPVERTERVERIRVMARSSLIDKLQMVQCLKEKGHVVAVTGDGMNDVPALKEADIGISMGIQGTEVAKESSDIIILDDNFASVVMVLRWGRCAYDNIQKLIQFQLTANIAALVINFLASISDSSGNVPMTAVQLLWVNMIVTTLLSFALGIEPPAQELLAKPPVGRTDPLITGVVWRNLIAHSLYQVTVLLALQYEGFRFILGGEEEYQKVKNTLIFNTFFLCQVFNSLNARKLEQMNIFKGLLENKLFLAIIGFVIIFQLVMVEILKRLAHTESLDLKQWGFCIVVAALSWPIDWLIKCFPIPDIKKLAACLIPKGICFCSFVFCFK